ncbi:MAG: PorT family protein [Cyclobacteriaceae bacterium]|nr:PorT family protein [Cyclobacteriaceae bacterium]
MKDKPNINQLPMKQAIILSFALLLFSSAHAQTEVAIGIKGGPNFATFDISDFEGSLKNRTGIHVGAFSLFKLGKIGIQPEVIYSQQGSKIRIDGQELEGNFQYMNIPIMLKLYTVLGLNLQVGPQFGFLSSAEIDGNNVKEIYKNSDTSLAFGVGWDLPMRLTVDARYNLGLSDINDSSTDNTVKNQVFQISVGFKLFRF